VLPIEKPRIVVYKKERKLEFYSDKSLLRTYRIGLGFSPVADKVREGDGATPEGDFYIFVKNNKSAYYLSLGVSYPNIEDADRGLRDGLITRAQHAGLPKRFEKRLLRRSTRNSAVSSTFTATVRGAIGHGAVLRWRMTTSRSYTTLF